VRVGPRLKQLFRHRITTSQGIARVIRASLRTFTALARRAPAATNRETLSAIWLVSLIQAERRLVAHTFSAEDLEIALEVRLLGLEEFDN